MKALKYIAELLPAPRFYGALAGCSLLFFLSYFVPTLYDLASWTTAGMLLLTLADYTLLFFIRGGLYGERRMTSRFSLGDNNEVILQVENSYPYAANVVLIDEIPLQFQDRGFRLKLHIDSRSHNSTSINLRPITRGEYQFGILWAFAKTPLGLLQRRFALANEKIIKVYPSFKQLRQYQLLAIADQPVYGGRKVHRLGHSMEFEKIKEYVQGDDVRTINWKATARRGDLMVNTYTDARQQQIYCILDKGRAMKAPFDGMTLLDHSINAALSLLNVALLKGDRAGLVTFSQKINDVVAADRRSGQMPMLLEALYRQETGYKESNYEALAVDLHRSLNQRGLLLIFTNFETMASLERQLPYLRRLAARHLLCVVFFQNTLLQQLHETQPDNTEGIYIKTIADQFDYEKRQIVKELRKYGILSILTTPQSLSIDVINRYLALKARQMV